MLRFDALEVDAAVAGDADDDELAFAGGQGDGEDDVLERVGGCPGAAVGVGTGHQDVGGVDERVDGGRVRGVPDLGGRGVAEVDVRGNHRGDGLDVGRVAAGERTKVSSPISVGCRNSSLLEPPMAPAVADTGMTSRPRRSKIFR